MGHAEFTLRDQLQPRRISLDEYWMPFTPNRDFKSDPKMVVRAEGMYYWNDRGEKLIDAASGMFCCAAGHGRKEIAEAVYKQLQELDFIAPFEGHNVAEFTLNGKGDATHVTWAMYGPASFVAKLMGVFFSMDSMIGKDFEAGLAALKAIAEK